jgi:uncharacterized protein (TIGR01777 family)
MLTEDEPPGDDFLTKVGRDWEKEALKVESKGARVVLTRFGIALGRNGGAMAKMIPAFRMFVGGPLGSGRQWFSWIHLRDLINTYFFVIDRQDLHGPLNYCAPEPVRNEQLVKTLADKLKRPAVLKAPAFIVRLVLGEFGKVLLESQQVRPEKRTSPSSAFPTAPHMPPVNRAFLPTRLPLFDRHLPNMRICWIITTSISAAPR